MTPRPFVLPLVAAGIILVTAANAANADEHAAAAQATADATDGATPTGHGAPESDWTVLAIAGSTEDDVVRVNGEYRSGRSRIESPLPEGYPRPTAPGAIELKRYPAVRRAEITGGGSADRGQWSGFWPLFQHIKGRDIAMTSPVEMDYHGWAPNAGRPEGPWTMSFLYRTADLGPTGSDGNVLVVDAAPMTVLSIGIRGPYGTRTVSAGLAQLHAWIEQQDEWVIDGDPRALYYNGPYIRDRDKWCEAQVPVRRAADATAEAAPPASPALAPATADAATPAVTPGEADPAS